MAKLYYDDPYVKHFSTEILKQEQDASTKKWFVILKETAFYPTGGGQPCDQGLISGHQVTQVEEIKDEVRHYLDQPMEDIEQEVDCYIDWKRRFDHMQQHTGQHILSAAFVKLFNIDTIAFHLGDEVSTIDLEIASLSREELRVGEELANQIILENRPIETTWVTRAEVENYPLRKQPSVDGDIRLVIIPEFDYNGCGGTHPDFTGEVNGIKILSSERQKNNVRIQFVCGHRLRTQLQQKHQIIEQLNNVLNAPQAELVTEVDRLLSKEKQLEFILNEKIDFLLQYEAEKLINNSSDAGVASFKVVHKVFHDRSIKELQKLANTIVQQKQHVVAFLVNEAEDKLQFVCSRDKQTELNLKKLAPDFLSLINGKGGGKSHQIQGGGPSQISAEEFIDKAFAVILEAGNS